MNIRQKIAIVAVIIIALMGLFPPWRLAGVLGVTGVDTSAGYAFLLDPPSKDNWGLFAPQMPTHANQVFSLSGSVHVDLDVLLIQWAIVAILAWGIAYALERDNQRMKVMSAFLLAAIVAALLLMSDIQTTARQVQSIAEDAQRTAVEAQTTAEEAKTTAEEAQSTAEDAQMTAEEARSRF